MKLITTMATVITVMAVSSSFAQKIKWEKGGDLAFMKGQTTVATQYDYANVTVKGAPEQTYVNDQKADLNADKAGDGDAFAAEWTDARAKKYQPGFEKGFNKSLEKDGIAVNNEGNAKYTVMVVTNDMQLGKGKTFVRKPALVTYSIIIVETANKDNIVAKGTLEEVEGEVNAPKGSGWIPGGVGTAMSVTANVQNRDYSNRIAKSYEKAGEILGKSIRKAI